MGKSLVEKKFHFNDFNGCASPLWMFEIMKHYLDEIIIWGYSSAVAEDCIVGVLSS